MSKVTLESVAAEFCSGNSIPVERATLTRERMWEALEAYAAAKVREAMSAAYEKVAQRSMSMPHYSDFERGYAEGRTHAAMEIREFIPKEST